MRNPLKSSKNMVLAIIMTGREQGTREGRACKGRGGGDVPQGSTQERLVRALFIELRNRVSIQ